MPLYEYVCHSCDHRFETLLRAWTDTTSCPQCPGGGDVERLLSTFAMAGFGAGSGASSAPMFGGGGGCGRPGGCGCGSGGCGCARS